CGEGSAEAVSRQALGRSAHEIGVREPALQKRLDAASLHRMFTAGVVGLAAAGDLSHQGVEQDVARRRLEADHLGDTASGGELAGSASGPVAAANVSPSSRCSRLTWRVSHSAVPPETRRIRSRSSGGYGWWMAWTSRARNSSPTPAVSINAASTPSALEPDAS